MYFVCVRVENSKSLPNIVKIMSKKHIQVQNAVKINIRTI